MCLLGVTVSKDVSLDELAKLSDAFSGADVQEFVNEAKKSVLKRKIKGDATAESVTEADFRKALSVKKRSRV